MCVNVFLIGKAKPDNSVQLWPLALVMGHLSRCPTQWHMHFLACLSSHFWHFLQYFSFSLTLPDESLVGKCLTGCFGMIVPFGMLASHRNAMDSTFLFKRCLPGFSEVSIEGGYRRWTAGYFALSRRLLSSQIVLDISQKRSIAVFLESKIALNLIS